MNLILRFYDVDSGTQAQLLAKNGHFAQLWHMQAGGFLPANAQ